MIDHPTYDKSGLSRNPYLHGLGPGVGRDKWLNFLQDPLPADAVKVAKTPVEQSKTYREQVGILFHRYSRMENVPVTTVYISQQPASPSSTSVSASVLPSAPATSLQRVMLYEDLHALLLAEGYEIFEFMLVRFMTKMLVRVDTAFANAMPGNEIESVVPIKQFVRLAVKECFAWQIQEFNREKSTRSRTSREDLRQRTDALWDTLDYEHRGYLTETQFAFYLQDILQCIVPGHRHTEAMESLQDDLSAALEQYQPPSKLKTPKPL
jgi:hypothetical protein